MARDSVTIVVIVLILLLVGVGVYVLASDPETAVEDNYQYSNGYTTFDVQKVSDTLTHITLLVGDDEVPISLTLRNDPRSLEDIPVSGTFNTRIFNDELVYVTFNPRANLTGKGTIAIMEISDILGHDYLYDLPVYAAITEPYGGYAYPIKTCADATDTETVIWVTLGSETTVYTENNCIVVVGTSEDELIRSADRFVLTLLGIMQ